MTNPHMHSGQVIISGPDMQTQEYDCFTCCHCNAIIIVQRSGSVNLWSPPEKIAIIGTAPSEKQEVARQKSTRRRGFCFRCMAPTCGRGDCTKCIPFEAKMEALEGSRRFWKDNELWH